jgi:hypothetical protein
MYKSFKAVKRVTLPWERGGCKETALQACPNGILEQVLFKREGLELANELLLFA